MTTPYGLRIVWEFLEFIVFDKTPIFSLLASFMGNREEEIDSAGVHYLTLRRPNMSRYCHYEIQYCQSLALRCVSIIYDVE